MRTLSAAALAELATKEGTEPSIIIEVQWQEDGPLFRYGDVEITEVPGKILSVAGLDNTITISGVTTGVSGDSQQISVTIDDTDETIRTLLDNTDVHKRPVWVYQHFKGLPFDDRFLIFKGQVSSPIEWAEGDRTARFDIVSRIEDQEIGFSIEEGDFLLPSAELVGKAWPLAFGSVINIPGLRTRSLVTGTLKDGFGIRDPAKAARLDQLNKLCCPRVFRGYYVRLTIGGQSATPIFSDEPGCYCRKQSQIETLEQEIALESSYEYSSIEIIDGDIFPQGETITLNICDAKVTGKFDGTADNPSTTFLVQKYVHPELAGNPIPPVKHFCTSVTTLPPGTDPNNVLTNRLPGLASGGNQYVARNNVLFAIVKCADDEDYQDLGWDYLSKFPKLDFFWAEPGCEVFVDGDEQIVWVANLLPSTVHRVAAYRTFDSGNRQLTTVPPSFYTTRISDFNGYMVTEIVMNTTLSRRNEGWEDQLYVSMTSTVGPNTVDILEWIINKYTDFAIDSTSFDDVKAKLTVYPSDFPILERRNVLDVLKDIAFQARCALVLRNDTFFIHYLSEEPDVDFTIIDDDVLPGSLVHSHTDTEDLVTKFIAQWKKDYAIDDSNTAIYRHNVKRYGIHDQEFDFFIYNKLELVRKSATFWLIRMANTWRRLKFKTPMTKLQAETLDTAGVTLSGFVPGEIKSIVEEATYDSDNFEIQFQVLTNVLAGTKVPYEFFWPANIDEQLIWPTKEERDSGNAGGSGPNVDVKPPSSHPLALPTGFTANIKRHQCGRTVQGEIHSFPDCRADQGDQQPSDIGDTAPVDGQDGTGIPGEDEPPVPVNKNPLGIPSDTAAFAQQCCEEANAEARNGRDAAEQARENQGGSDNGGPPSSDEELQEQLEQMPAGCAPGGECVACVRMCMFKKVTAVRLPTGGNSNTEGDIGQAIGNQSGPENNFDCEYFTFNSLEEAQRTAARWDAIGESYEATVGQPWISSQFTGFIAASSNWTGDCEEPNEEDRAAVGYSPAEGDDALKSTDDGIHAWDENFKANDADGNPTLGDDGYPL